MGYTVEMVIEYFESVSVMPAQGRKVECVSISTGIYAFDGRMRLVTISWFALEIRASKVVFVRWCEVLPFYEPANISWHCNSARSNCTE